MENGISILAIVISIIISITPIIRNKYFSRPEIIIEIIRTGGSSSKIGYRSKDELKDQNFKYDNKAISIFEVVWKFRIRLTNNSEFVAYYPKITFKPYGPKISVISNLNTNQPINNTKSIDLEIEYTKLEEIDGQKRTDFSLDLPPEFSELGILLTYQNSSKIVFHTCYNFSQNKNKFLKKTPKEYKQFEFQ